MVGALKWQASEWLTGGLHFIIIAVAAQAESAEAWSYALAAMSVVSFFAWIAAYRRYRQIHDLPTSNVASAAQGYVELFGRSEQVAGEPVTSKLTGLPCCWFRYYIERKSSDDRGWTHEDSGASNAHFLLVDDSGECVISPEDAEVISARKQTWTQGDHRYTEWLLLPKGILYALGEFATVGGANAELDERADVNATLADWKQGQAKLFERFDLNRDGKIDLKEWELARLQARREVRGKHAEIRSRDGMHILRKPRDGRLFLLANELPDKLGSRFAFWSWLHLIVFFAAGAGSLLLFA
ncbi:MAG: hypothetical protein HYV99_04075 [Betaproteobacteria bacterium]|nr:hypothetical protein [Betaproteobacteria bacterium]MBI2509162.1 hypothetical protein [Betaproteobacteria bacterium]